MPRTKKPAMPIEVIVKPLPPEAEAQLVEQIARFLLTLTAPEKPNQPHTRS